jgi:putative glutamine amidotransferase
VSGFSTTAPGSGVVGILAGRSPAERYSLHAGYVDSVNASGGFPVILPTGPGVDPERLAAHVLACDAILVSGGIDVDPSLSRIDDPSDAIECDRARDDAEIVAVHTAVSSGRRVLGICRGIQILAVAFGGSLVGDLDRFGCPGHNEVDRQYEPVHGIVPERGSVAELILGSLTVVNSAHHQAVNEPGDGFVPTARTADGVIEAIEAPGILGIQWHPERLSPADPRHLAPFRWLIS